MVESGFQILTFRESISAIFVALKFEKLKMLVKNKHLNLDLNLKCNSVFATTNKNWQKNIWLDKEKSRKIPENIR